MSQNDFTLANQSFPSFRADLNSALQALASNNSGTSAPSTTFANMWWYDSANNILYIRNEDNDAWIQFATLDQANDLFVVTSSIDVGDNVKALFGDSDDLQIYHDGSNSIVYEGGTGTLKLATAGGSVDIVKGSDSSETMAKFNINGAVSLYYDNAVKLATTSTGIDVTGTAVTDGLTVAGNLSVDGGTIKLDGNYPTGTDNVALGNTALDDGSLSGDYNTAIGAGSLTANTSGVRNTACGQGSLASNTTGERNTAVGRSALYSSTGSYNTAVGMDALVSNTSASNNTAVGQSALASNTTASNNTAVGQQAGYSNTTGTSNVFFGRAAGFSNTTGSENTAVGRLVLFDNTTGANNTALGRSALENNTTASNNVAVGYQSGYSVTTGISNTFVGKDAGKSQTTSNVNTFIGADAGYYVTTGAKNTIIGAYNGNQSGLDIRTASNRIVLSDGDGNPRIYVDDVGNTLIAKVGRGFNTTGVELRQGSDGVDSHFTVDNGTVCSFNRKTSDGAVVNFGQDGTVEGQINISGTTTSYLGGHLSRWSRLLDNSKDTSIVKGTVMTNLDEMVEWDDEDNEQLNKMAVSSVEGDANVAGVFVNWDDDDNYNDMNVAMTGDMVIRIAQGTTVARGDLLMSAGDGTAKPQGDDIVRSKTIAKVTSTNVSHTYDDGTYLVPCVLMAC
jgi:hypothetical protein